MPSRATRSANGAKTRTSWAKTNVSEVGTFAVTCFKETGPLKLDAIRVAEERDGEIVDAGEVRFGFAGRQLWSALDPLRQGPADRYGVIPVRSQMRLRVKHFGGHKGGAIRDGVVVGIDPAQVN
jgi:hypothetical protein